MATDENSADLSKVIKRLWIIKSLILLDEESEISTHVVRLRQFIPGKDVETIILLLERKAYSQAMSAIEAFINRYHQVDIYIDPELEGLKLEAKVLEAEINELSETKADLEKLIHEFGVRHNKELGELIIKILQYRKENAKGTAQQQEAEEDYNTYNKEYEASKNEKVATLTEEEQKELKDKYRKASKLCHPDVVSEQQKELATKLFAELSAAYEKNDIKQVREILENFEKGHFFINKSDAINKKQLLQVEIKKLQLRIKELEEQLQLITESDTYKTIISIDSWDEYFANAKQKLQIQLNDLVSG